MFVQVHLQLNGFDTVYQRISGRAGHFQRFDKRQPLNYINMRKFTGFRGYPRSLKSI